MRPVSERFLRAITGSHSMFARARVVSPGQSGTDPVGVEIPIHAGDVDLDGTRPIRSTLELEVEGGQAFPETVSDLITPYGNEVFVERGILFGDGIREIVYLSYFRITDVEQDDAPRGPIRISGEDRMAAVVEAVMLEPRQYPAELPYGAVFEELVLEVLPAAIIEWDDNSDSQLLGRTVILEEDRYGFLNDLVEALGKVWYFDHRGVLVIKDPPEPADAVWSVAGGELGTLTKMSRRLSRRGVYNAVVASGEAADEAPPTHAVAVDDNPASPTYWGAGDTAGPFGRVPRRYSSPLLTTDSAAQKAARSMLVKSLGLPYAVDLTAVPNPALEPYDPIKVRYDSLGREELHVIDKLKIPLTAAGAWSCSTREQQVILVGVS